MRAYTEPVKHETTTLQKVDNFLWRWYCIWLAYKMNTQINHGYNNYNNIVHKLHIFSKSLNNTAQHVHACECIMYAELYSHTKYHVTSPPPETPSFLK